MSDGTEPAGSTDYSDPSTHRYPLGREAGCRLCKATDLAIEAAEHSTPPKNTVVTSPDELQGRMNI